PERAGQDRSTWAGVFTPATGPHPGAAGGPRSPRSTWAGVLTPATAPATDGGRSPAGAAARRPTRAGVLTPAAAVRPLGLGWGRAAVNVGRGLHPGDGLRHPRNPRTR